MMMAENPKITVEVESKGVKKVNDELKDLKRTGESADKTTKALGTSLKAIGVAVASLGLGAIVSQLAKTADSMKLLEARTINASKSIALGVENFKELKKQATDAGVALEGTVQLFQRLSNTRNSIGATNAEILKLTDTVSKLGVISGASPEAIKNSMLQFSQAMAGGIVRAEEFNSVLENTPELAVKIAEGMGVSVGQLRKLVIEGNLLSKDVFNVLLKQSEQVNKEFATMPMTFGRLKSQADITFGSLIADIDKATGASGLLLDKLLMILQSVDRNREAFIEFGSVTIGVTKTVVNLVQMIIRGALGGIAFLVESTLDSFLNFTKMVNAFLVESTLDSFLNFTKMVNSVTGLVGVKIPTGGLQFAKDVASFSRKGFFKDAGIDVEQIRNEGTRRQSVSSLPVPRDIRGGIDPVTGSKGKNKKSAGESEAEKEAKRYAEALQGLKDKARDASMELAGLRSAQQALQTGGVTSYENQLLQNEGMKQFVELMGDYYGKGKKNLELIAQKIVTDNKAIELQKKTLEYNVKMKQLQTDLNFEEEKAKQLRDAFLAGGEKALELKRRELEIETRKRELLQGSGLSTSDAEAQAKAQAEAEARVNEFKTQTDEMVARSKQAGEDIRSALTTAWDNTVTQMINGTATFKDIMVGLLRQVAVALVKVYTLQLITGFVGSHMTGGANAGASASTFDRIGANLNIKATPARAGGGAVSAGVPYMVGESGRELFVPRTSGNIMPSHAMKNPSSGGSVTIVNNMTINTQGGKDDGKDLLQAGKDIIRTIEYTVRKVLKDESRPGGMLQRGFA
jgi:tape measure domain-containing protein